MNRRHLHIVLLATGLSLSACGSFQPFAQSSGEYEDPNNILAKAKTAPKSSKPSKQPKAKKPKVANNQKVAKPTAPVASVAPKPEVKAVTPVVAKPVPAPAPEVKSSNKANLNADAQAIMAGLKGATPEVRGVVQEALSYLGTPYKYGGMSASGVDCSGLMCLAFTAANIELPRIAGDQAAFGKSIAKNSLKPGDMLFFSADKPGSIGHSALVVAVGENSVRFVHASSSKGVRIDELYTDHWTKHYIKACRVW